MESIDEIYNAQKSYFNSGATLPITERRRKLKALKVSIQKKESVLYDALLKDLHKSYEEAFLTELSIVYSELDNHYKQISRWAKAEPISTPLKMMPSQSQIVKQPLGLSLIIAPWNYPVQLLLCPLIGALSSGCTALLKPSPYVPHVSAALSEIIADTFRTEEVALVQGNRDVNNELLAKRWDIIFFTGSPTLGKHVMTMAAQHLTPVVLELGGKSPCIIDDDADIKIAAKRVAWGKCLNAGQTCIAPDYLLIHETVKETFINELEKQFQLLLGEDAKTSKHFARIVNDKSFERLANYIRAAQAHDKGCGEIIYGGIMDESERYITPTLIDHVAPDSPILQEEIFGPIFPIITIKNYQEALTYLSGKEKPLALYYFGKKGVKIIERTQSGGACINDTIMHIANENLPFGGVGQSGISSYHGKQSFDVFTHHRSVVTNPTWLDLPFRYMPYKWFKWVKKLITLC